MAVVNRLNEVELASQPLKEAAEKLFKALALPIPDFSKIKRLRDRVPAKIEWVGLMAAVVRPFLKANGGKLHDELRELWTSALFACDRESVDAVRKWLQEQFQIGVVAEQPGPKVSPDEMKVLIEILSFAGFDALISEDAIGKIALLMDDSGSFIDGLEAIESSRLLPAEIMSKFGQRGGPQLLALLEFGSVKIQQALQKAGGKNESTEIAEQPTGDNAPNGSESDSPSDSVGDVQADQVEDN